MVAMDGENIRKMKKKEESLSDYERYPDVNTLSKKDQNGWDRM